MVIKEYLLSVGIRPNIKGFKFLTKAIELVIKDETYLDSITKRLYPDVAKYFIGESASKVERAIRHSIDSAKIEVPNSEFIALAVIKMENM